MAAEKGNRYAERHSVKEWIELFEKVYEKALTGKYLRLAEAYMDLI